MRRSVLCCVVLSTSVGCGGKEDEPEEGEIPFSCEDGADNDGDGLFDCDDPGCAGSPDCADTTTAMSTGTTGDTGHTGTTGTTGTTDPDPLCLQEDAVASSSVAVQQTLVILDSSTLALSTPSTTPAGPLPPGVSEENYIGAVDPSAALPWWLGWTYTNSFVDANLPAIDQHPLADDFGTDILASTTSQCTAIDASFGDGGTVQIGGEAFPVCVVSGRITATQSWPNSHVFLLDGTVNVGNGDVGGGVTPISVTLTLQAGTQIYAVNGTETSLVITRGSELNAFGTFDLPIIFGAVEADSSGTPAIAFDDPTDLTSRGEWGGVVLSGFGQINDGDANNERLTDFNATGQERYFGGTNDGDSSGSLQYVVIAEAGIDSAQGLGVPGLSLEAVGNGTTLEYVQVIGSEGDGIAFVGGAVGGRWLITQAADDDGIDIDSGYRGRLQNVLVMLGDPNGDRGIESDNLVSDFDATPRTDPDLVNFTIIGGSGGSVDDTVGILHRTGATAGVYRSVVTDGSATRFEAGCFDIDDQLPPDLVYEDVLFDCSPQSIVCDDDTP